MDSYNDILQRMKDKYEELRGQPVPELSDIDIRMKVLAGEIYNDEVNLEFIKRQMFAKSATGRYLDLHAEDRGLKRKAAVKAKGLVTFSIPVAIENDIIIPKNTIVATAGETSYRFKTNVDITIYAGGTSATVLCTAEKGGRASNVRKKTISVIVTSVTGVETVTNSDSFTGGADGESDENLRKRILESYVSISNGTNAAYYEKLALSVDGVTGANIVPKGRGVGTVDVYIASEEGTPTLDQISKVQMLMDDERELNVDILVCGARPYNINLGVNIQVAEGYDFEDVKSRVEKALGDYIESLSIGDSVLETHLGKAILDVDGVYTYSWFSNYDNTFIMPVDAYPFLNSITIEEEEI